MTNRERNDYWHKWNRFQQRWEKYYTARFTKALKIQAEAYIKTQEMTSIPSFPIYTALVDLYKKVGPAWARTVLRDGIKDGRMGFSEEIIRLMNEYFGIDLLNDAEDITAYTRYVIGKILSKGAQDGLSFDEMAKMIMMSTELGPMRARRIARTETVTAANGAAMITAKRSGAKMTKTWISIQDKRTRHNQWANHYTIDGLTVDYEEPFKLQSQRLGEILMQQPGVRTQDNGLPVPAVEVVNCRCTVAFAAKRDSRGRIIRA